MTFVALIACLVIAALIYEKWQNSKDRRERDAEWRLERTGLLTRIQAPEAAPFVISDEGAEQQYVDFDDDDDFQKAMEVLKEVEYREEVED
jgi:hypothetical protein